MIKTVQSANDHIVNKTMIGWHILGYLLITIAYILENFATDNNNSLKYEDFLYYLLATNLICTIILALIISEIRSKAKQ